MIMLFIVLFLFHVVTNFLIFKQDFWRSLPNNIEYYILPNFNHIKNYNSGKYDSTFGIKTIVCLTKWGDDVVGNDRHF